MSPEERTEMIAAVQSGVTAGLKAGLEPPTPRHPLIRYWAQLTGLLGVLVLAILFYARMEAHAEADHHDDAGDQITQLERENDSLKKDVVNLSGRLDTVTAEQHRRTPNVSAVQVLDERTTTMKDDIAEIKGTLKELLALTVKDRAGGG